MRVKKTVSALAVLLMVASASAQEPASVDALLDKLAATRKQQADLAKLANDLTGEIQTRLLALNKRLAEINGAPLPLPPGPVVPPANDPLKEKVAKAFAADPGTAAEKKKDVGQLAALYSVAVDQKLANDETITTSGALIARIRAAGTSLAADRLPGTRRVIADEIASALKTADTPLTPELRSLATGLFARIEAALEEVSK